MINIHPAELCRGQYCPFHNPSDHHMVDWPLHIRFDRDDYLTERICEHGTGHPDPDSLNFLKQHYGPDIGVHGCDGCCHVARD